MRRSFRSMMVLALVMAPAAAAAQQAPGLRLRDDADRGEMVLEVGPVDLPDDGGHRQLPAFHGTVPVDGWLHGYRIEIVDASGRQVPRSTLHHVNVISPERRELFSQIMLRVAAAGQETDAPMLPRMLGYRVRPGQRLIVTAMMHNPTGRPRRGVTLRLRFPYTPAGAWIRPVSVLPFYMDVMPPASLHSYDLPAGRSTKSWEARPAVSGRIVGLGGHLHRHGVSLRLEDVTAGKVIWDGKPRLDQAGEVVGMPTKKFVWRLGVPVRADHLYRLTATYDNPTGRTIPGGGMGALGGAFVPEDEAKWPGVDHAHPELRLDWHLVHTGNQEGHGGGGHGSHGGGGAHGSHGAAATANAVPRASGGGHGSHAH